jgi:hypothetical protein
MYHPDDGGDTFLRNIVSYTSLMHNITEDDILLYFGVFSDYRSVATLGMRVSG